MIQIVCKRDARRLLALGSAILMPVCLNGAERIDFAHLTLEEDSFWNGSDSSGGFTTEGAWFNNEYNDDFHFWSGWAYSNVNDTETRGHENQYAAITGEGVAGHGIYGVAHVDYFEPVIPAIELPAHTAPNSITVTNTTYAYHSMNEGDDFAREFTTEDDDWFLLTITGLDGDGEDTGEIEFYLADFRFDDPDEAYIIDEWTEIDLTPLGDTARTVEFTLTSSDTGALGMNTPAYFAMGEMTVTTDRPFEAWMAMLPEDQRPPEGQRGPADEPAGDGINNLLKYAFGSMPMTPSAGVRPEVVVVEPDETGETDGEVLAMEFVRAKNAAVTLTLEGSDDLAGWVDVPSTTEVIAPVDDNRDRVRIQSEISPGDHETFFLRLNADLAEESP